jgi:hypothetical protein
VPVERSLVVAKDARLDIAVVAGDAVAEQIDRPPARNEPGVWEVGHQLRDSEDRGEGLCHGSTSMLVTVTAPRPG